MSSSNDPLEAAAPLVADAARPVSPEPLPQQRVLLADDLFVGQKEVLIRNGVEIYRLRRTRNGKLILCK